MGHNFCVRSSYTLKPKKTYKPKNFFS